MRRTALPFALTLLVAGSACGVGPLRADEPAAAVPATAEPSVRAHREVRADTLRLSLRNPYPIPVTFTVEGVGARHRAVLTGGDSALVAAVPLAGRDSATVAALAEISAMLGDHRARPDVSARYAYPFPRGRSYRVMQAYNGSFSHDDDGSRYAIDFALPVGDTVAAARAGVVVRAIDHHTRGGNDPALRDYGNFVTLYHADGMMSQYVHLAPGGALVAWGDSVRAGEPVGISGATGFTSRPHLHFNVVRPGPGAGVSVPVRFESADGRALREGSEAAH